MTFKILYRRYDSLHKLRCAKIIIFYNLIFILNIHSIINKFGILFLLSLGCYGDGAGSHLVPNVICPLWHPRRHLLSCVVLSVASTWTRMLLVSAKRVGYEVSALSMALVRGAVSLACILCWSTKKFGWEC